MHKAKSDVNTVLKTEHEKAVGNRFINFYNEENKFHFMFVKKGERPDLIYCDGETKTTIGVEVTDAYSNKEEAKGVLDIARKKANRIEELCYSNDELAQSIDNVISKHSSHQYDINAPVLLVVVVRPALTNTLDQFKRDVLPSINLPRRVPFDQIFLDVGLLPNHYFHLLYQRPQNKAQL